MPTTTQFTSTPEPVSSNNVVPSNGDKIEEIEVLSCHEHDCGLMFASINCQMLYIAKNGVLNY